MTMDDAMGMPEPSHHHQVLEKLTGRWSGSETMHASPMSPQARESVGSLHGRMLEGFFAISDYEQRVGGDVTFRGHGVYSYDAATDEYVMYWVDSMGGTGGTSRGRYEGNVLSFFSESPMGKHRYRYTFEQHAMHFQMAMSQDGETWTALMDATYQPA